jgi:hypothetical protein
MKTTTHATLRVNQVMHLAKGRGMSVYTIDGVEYLSLSPVTERVVRLDKCSVINEKFILVSSVDRVYVLDGDMRLRRIEQCLSVSECIELIAAGLIPTNSIDAYKLI